MMDILPILLLLTSIALGALRNVLTKGYSSLAFGKRGFYIAQGALFASGAVILLFDAGATIISASPLTLLYAAIYGILIVTAQWCYTVAMKIGKTGICSAVYSLAFIFPTLSGTIFFGETITLLNIFGIALVIPTIIISAKNPAKMVENKDNGAYFAPLLAAMLASGGMGVLQKIQQNSSVRDERGAFLFLAFAIAAAISAACAIISKNNDIESDRIDANQNNMQDKKYRDEKNINVRSIGSNVPKSTAQAASGAERYKIILAIPAAAGVCFAICNLINTTLAGILPSAVFFPLVNIGSIFASLALGIVIYKEKITKRDAIIVVLGVISILLISL